jgi:hypothetical protein
MAVIHLVVLGNFGEIIVFTHGRQKEEYTIEKII